MQFLQSLVILQIYIVFCFSIFDISTGFMTSITLFCGFEVDIIKSDLIMNVLIV